MNRRRHIFCHERLSIYEIYIVYSICNIDTNVLVCSIQILAFISLHMECFYAMGGCLMTKRRAHAEEAAPASVLPEDDFPRLMRDLAKVLTEPDIGEWMTTPSIGLLSVVRHHPQYWGLSKATYRKWGGNPYDLEKAVDYYRTTHDLDDLLEAATTPVDPFIFTDATSILAKSPMARRWLLPGIIADGLTLLGGSPKGGKTYLAYALALAVSHYGRWCNHWEVEQGKVIYITLEDDENDTHLRLLELDPGLQLATQSTDVCPWPGDHP